MGTGLGLWALGWGYGHWVGVMGTGLGLWALGYRQ